MLMHSAQASPTSSSRLAREHSRPQPAQFAWRRQETAGKYSREMEQTRLIVKNLPKHMTDQRLRELFGRHGEVTDARVQKTPDGRPRQFGFVGFRTQQEAAKALHNFSGT
jgi:RNA recognition motif-containing protein